MLKEKETEYLLKIEELKLDNEKMISNIKKTMEEKVIIYETRIKEMNELHLSDVSKLQIKFDKERIDITNSFEFKIKNLNNTIADMIEKLKNFGQNNNEKVKSFESDIEKLKKEIEEKNLTIQKNHEKIQDLVENINNLNNSIKKLEGEIENLKREIEAKTDQFNQKLKETNSSTIESEEKYKKEMRELEITLKQKHEDKLKEYYIN